MVYYALFSFAEMEAAMEPIRARTNATVKALRFPLAVRRDPRHPNDHLPFVVRLKSKHRTLARAETLTMAIAAARAYIEEHSGR